MDSSDATTGSYNGFAKLLHWLIAGMIVLQFVLARMAEEADSKFRELVLLANHKSVGITILALVLLRFGWRLYRRPPAALPMPRWQDVASRISHWGFYVLLFVIPVSGWLMSSASNISVSWFNLFQLPDFIGPNETAGAVFEEIHETLTKVLLVLALLHVGAALKHSFIDRDGIMRRITSPLALLTFVAVIVAGIMALTPASRAQGAPPPVWNVDYSASHIRFTAEQAGADFDGEWRNWEAELRFDAAQLDASAFDVVIEAAGVSTLDEERDQTLMDPEFFDGENFPRIRYRANDFSNDGDGKFAARGIIEVKGNSTPVELRFTVRQDGDRVVLDGSSTLDRLTLGVGTGEWEDTAWIGQFVDVNVHVEATLQRPAASVAE